MTKHTKNLRTHFLLTFCLILHVLPLPVQAQGQPIVFSFGRPSIWSLEQAHYLLARMHAENLGLVSKWPDDDVLDPNATNASRINLLKSMLELGVTYDQTAGLQNQATQRNFNRLQVLDGRLDARREELKTIEKELAALKVEEAEAKKNNPNDLNLPLKRVAVENKDAEKNRVNAEITSLEAERKELPKSSATPTKAEAGAADPTQLPDTLYETMLKNNNLNEVVRLLCLNDLFYLLKKTRPEKNNCTIFSCLCFLLN